MLLMVAATTRQFYQSRAQMGNRDGESQLIRAFSSSLVRELEGCFEVVQTSPDLILLTHEPGEAGRLPAHFPTPPPTPVPAWNPASSLMSVTFHYDSVDSTLWRSASFADGRTSQQRIAEAVYGFTVTNTTDRDFAVSLSYHAKRGIENFQVSVHRADD